MQSQIKSRPGPARASISNRIFLGLMAVIVVFSGAMLYSLLNHRGTVEELQLLNRGYLTLSFSIVEMRATQRVYNVLLERVLDEPDPSVTLDGLTSARRLRPMILDDLREVVQEIRSDTGLSDEHSFLDRVLVDLDDIEKLYDAGAEDYSLLVTLMRNGSVAEVEALFGDLQDQEREIETTLRHLQSASVHRINNVVARAEERQRLAIWMFTALILASLGLALLVTLYIRNLLNPLADLSRGAEAIGRGDLDHRIKVRRMDEIGRYASEFNQMVTALQERDRRLRHAERLAAVGKMASHIAHEVRNPLNSVGLNAEMISEEASSLPPSEARDEIVSLSKRVSDEVDRLTGITRQYLELGRLPSPEPIPTPLVELVSSVVDFLRPDMAERSVDLVLDAEEEGPVVSVDRDQMKQVLINLVRNASEAMDGDGERRIDVRVVTSDDVVLLSVKDTGRGVEEGDMEHIFEPFFSTREGGTGLGLSLTRHVVDEHGGRIECFSDRGKGTTFVITLPLRGESDR
ncbi:MAG: HAMP domain-containing protein [Deltaproteobacteria bacterium]|nr:HAMP domain-containing protein [Deltaproteobacteria bacterium]